MKNNMDLTEETNYTNKTLAQINNKIKHATAVVKGSKVVAGITGGAFFITALGAAGNSDYYTMVEKNFELADQLLARDLKVVIPFAAVTIGALAVKHFVDKYIEKQEDIKDDLIESYKGVDNEETDQTYIQTGYVEDEIGEQVAKEQLFREDRTLDRNGNVIDNSPEAVAERHRRFEDIMRQTKGLFDDGQGDQNGDQNQ